MVNPLVTKHTNAWQRWTRGRSAVVRWIGSLVVINIVWRSVRYALGFPIWGDEAFVAINFFHRGFAGMIEPLEYGQIVPLLFMWSELAVTRVLGMSEWALRLLPFLAGVAAVPLFARFAVATLDARGALLAVGIFAASYYPVRHGTELKPYSWDLLVSLMLTCLAWRVWQQPQAVRRWLLLIVTGAASVWMSYPAAFVAAGIALSLTWIIVRQRSARIVGLWIAYGAIVAGSFLAVFLLCAQPHAEATWAPGSEVTVEIWGRGFPPVEQPWLLPMWFLRVHTGYMMAYPLGGKNGGSTFTFVLVAVGAIALWRRNRPLLALLLTPALFTLLAAAMQRYPYGTTARLAQHLAPAICLLTGVGLASALRLLLPPRRVSRVVLASAAVLAIIAAVGIVRDVVRPYKTFADNENRRVLRDLAHRAGPNDRWISFNVPEESVAHADSIYPRGGHGARHRYYLHRLAPVPLHWAPPPEQLDPPPAGQTWLIVYRDNRAPFPEDALAVYVAALTEQSGPPDHHTFIFAPDEQWMEVYEFPIPGQINGMHSEPRP